MEFEKQKTVKYRLAGAEYDMETAKAMLQVCSRISWSSTFRRDILISTEAFTQNARVRSH
jgi:hypothetical protein